MDREGLKKKIEEINDDDTRTVLLGILEILIDFVLPRNESVCDDCGTRPPVWKIYIKREYWGEYGKIGGYVCDECLILAIEGFHTGGGLVSPVVKKIVRMW